MKASLWIAQRTVALVLVTFVIIIGAEAEPTAAPTDPSRDFNTSHLDFFYEHPRLHLTEGTHQKWIYNVDSTECARRCTLAGSEEPDRIMCKSFEFFPFEDSRPDPPWSELPHNGICVLNSDDMDSGRLRYEDEGMTDAELLYTSHFTHRYSSSHFSAIDRTRGNNSVLYEDIDGRIPIASSRLGGVILTKPQILRRHFNCLASQNGANETVEVYAHNVSQSTVYTAAFDPIDVRTNACPEKADKMTATAICSRAGAELCTQRELRMIFTATLGCGTDGADGVFPQHIWAFDDPIVNRSETKLVKCCTEHRLPMFCNSYSKANIDYCSQFTTEDQCVREGSGFTRQAQYGYGLLLNEIRRGCVRDEYACGRTTFSEWTPRDRCLWCGNQCRPGSDVGICPPQGRSASLQVKRTERFAELFNFKCSPDKACALASAYPDLSKYLVDPFEFESGQDVSTPPPSKPDCRQLKTAESCLRYYDDCYWGKYYSFQVCRPLAGAKAPTKKKTKKAKKKKNPKKG